MTNYIEPDNWFNQLDDSGNMVRMMSTYDGNRAVTPADYDALHAQQDAEAAAGHQRVIDAGGVWNTSAPTHTPQPGEWFSNAYTRPDGVPGDYQLYGADNGQGMYWAPANWAQPNHDNGFGQNMQDFFNPHKNGGFNVIYTAAGAGLGAALGGAGAAGDGALAGGGEVGSGYAASAPGAGAGYGTAGSSGAGNLYGSAGNDTLGGSNTMFDDYGNPLDMGSSPNVGDPNATGSFDQFGNANPNGTNPTGDYSSPSLGIQDYLNYLKQGSSAINGYGSLTSLLGKLLQTGLGVAGSRSQQQQLQGQANQYSEMGAPYRARLAAMYNDPASFYNSAQVQIPTQQATNMLARSLSMQGGNPVGSGNALQALQNYSANQLFGQFGNEANRLANFGGLSQFNAAAPGAQTNAIGAGAGVYNALGAGASDIFNPQPSLAQSMAEYRRLMQAVPVA